MEKTTGEAKTIYRLNIPPTQVQCRLLRLGQSSGQSLGQSWAQFKVNLGQFKYIYNVEFGVLERII